MATARLSLIALLFGIGFTTPSVSASTVVGIFAIVDAVHLEPDEATPERIRIAGTFVVPVPVSSGEHKQPERGHVCFSLPPGMEEEAKKDWAALKSVAGTGRVVGFGKYWVVVERWINGTFNTSLVVRIDQAADTLPCEAYPEPNERGIVTSFDTDEDARPRFGQPSMAIVSKLLDAHRQ